MTRGINISLIAVADPGEGLRVPAPLFLDHNEAQRAKKNFFCPPPPPPHYVKVWIHHWIVSVRWDCITLQLSLLAGYIFTDCILIIKFILL